MDGFNRLVATLLGAAVVLLAFLTVIAREMYYETNPHLRPQTVVPAGSVEACGTDCVIKRLDRIEARLKALEGSRH